MFNSFVYQEGDYVKITDTYKNIPISGRYGVGGYTYKCVIDNSAMGVKKYEIFANSINEVLYIVGCTFGNILSWSYIGNDVMSLNLSGFPDGSCFIFQ